MSEFTEHPEEYDAELREAGVWLEGEVCRAAEEKHLRGLTWELRYGERRSGGTGGVPSLRQWGFQVTGVAPNGEAFPLRCFLEESIVQDNPELAAQILGLWMDRVETGG